ncbi:hypothetical protein EDC04DRAFT_2599717 [Pisolithus marmoratus]|nr:hypothetical protein EDC04DRAFT_2599717 [Pisolithus marmoratus]
MANYTLPVMALIWMLARAGDNCSYCLPLPDTLCTKVNTLGSTLCRGGNVSCSIHNVLTHIWMSKWEKTCENLLPCPTKWMLSLVTLERDGKHKEPKSELKQQSASSFGQDDEKACNALQCWFTEHVTSPFNQIQTLQNQASAIAYQTIAKAIITLWEQRVLWEINMCISYDALADDIGNHNVGYSFLADRQNTWFVNHDSLAHKFISNPSTSGHFGVKRNGRMIWDKATLWRQLADYAEFQEQLLLCCETLSGAPGHGTELTPLTLCNTRDYHKSAAITSLENLLILHMLDGLAGDLVMQSLAIAWPFAELASYICYLHKPDVLQLYKTQLFVNHKHLFTSENISHSMAKLSSEHMQVFNGSSSCTLYLGGLDWDMHIVVIQASSSSWQELESLAMTFNMKFLISEEKIADQVAAKLEKKILENLEALLTDRLVATIGPAIQTIVKDAVQEVMTSISTNLSASHGKTDAPPTNSANWDMMYVDPSPPEDDIQLAPKEKGR